MFRLAKNRHRAGDVVLLPMLIVSLPGCTASSATRFAAPVGKVGEIKKKPIECELVRQPDGGYVGVGTKNQRVIAQIYLQPDSCARPFDWCGTFKPSSGNERSIALAAPSEEFYRSGAIQTPNGWFKLTAFEQVNGHMRFSYIADRDERAPATSIDLEIVQRAREILSDTTGSTKR